MASPGIIIKGYVPFSGGVACASLSPARMSQNCGLAVPARALARGILHRLYHMLFVLAFIRWAQTFELSVKVMLQT
jgi:hypothetical protein